MAREWAINYVRTFRKDNSWWLQTALDSAKKKISWKHLYNWGDTCNTYPKTSDFFLSSLCKDGRFVCTNRTCKGEFFWICHRHTSCSSVQTTLMTSNLLSLLKYDQEDVLNKWQNCVHQCFSSFVLFISCAAISYVTTNVDRFFYPKHQFNVQLICSRKTHIVRIFFRSLSFGSKVGKLWRTMCQDLWQFPPALPRNKVPGWLCLPWGYGTAWSAVCQLVPVSLPSRRPQLQARTTD